MTVIPRIEIRSGFSLGKTNQLIQAPNMGIINFHVFRLETFTPSRPKSPNQIVIAIEDTIANHPKA